MNLAAPTLWQPGSLKLPQSFGNTFARWSHVHSERRREKPAQWIPNDEVMVTVG